MYKLFVHQDAEGDLEQLWADDPTAAARIGVLLEECEGTEDLEANQDLLDHLTIHNFGDAAINVSKWLEHWNKGANLWRLKLWGLETRGMRYRIIYAFVPGKRHYHVLAIAPRDFNYESNHELTKRILRAYAEL